MTRTLEIPRTHYLHDESVHYKWDTENEPMRTVDSGDTVVVWTRDISDNQVGPDADASALINFDWDRAYPLTGPIGIRGAEPGDALKVEVLDIHTQGWGWTGVLPGFGLLVDEFPDAYLRTFDLTNGEFAYLRDDIAVPLDPYFGTMGVCPAGANNHAVVPPASPRVHVVSAGAGRGGSLLVR
jgi:acetamidase/formamidase